MPLKFDANLELAIDGQRATLHGSGATLRLTLRGAHMLRKLFAVALPQFGDATNIDYSLIPRLLASEGLTLEVADGRGPLLILGAAAAGKGYALPGIGRLEHVRLAGPGALLRLALNL